MNFNYALIAKRTYYSLFDPRREVCILYGARIFFIKNKDKFIFFECSAFPNIPKL